MSEITEEWTRIRTSYFPLSERDLEYHEQGDCGHFPGEAISEHLVAAFIEQGYRARCAGEDWGWWIGTKNDGASFEIGVYCVGGKPPALDYHIGVFGRGLRKRVPWGRSYVLEFLKLQQHLKDTLNLLPNSEILSLDANPCEFDETADR